MTVIDIEQLIRALVSERVRFVVIGSVAVAAYGYIRGTRDIDVVPDPDRENLLALGNALLALGAVLPRAGGEPFDHAKHDSVLNRGGNLTVMTDAGGLDVVQRVAGMPSFVELDGQAIDTELFGLPVRVCSLTHLRAMKEAAGRTIDRADLENLPSA